MIDTIILILFVSAAILSGIALWDHFRSRKKPKQGDADFDALSTFKDPAAIQTKVVNPYAGLYSNAALGASKKLFYPATQYSNSDGIICRYETCKAGGYDPNDPWLKEEKTETVSSSSTSDSGGW